MALKRQLRKSRTLAATVGPIKSPAREKRPKGGDEEAPRAAAAEDVLTRGEKTRQAGSGEVQFTEERKGGELTAPESRKPAGEATAAGGVQAGTRRGPGYIEAEAAATRGTVGGEAAVPVKVAEVVPPPATTSTPREGGRTGAVAAPAAEAKPQTVEGKPETVFRRDAGRLSIAQAPAARQTAEEEEARRRAARQVLAK